MDGGKGINPDCENFSPAGGAGGVIQIIAPEGEIAAETLSLKHGEDTSLFCDTKAKDGYFLLEGS